MQPLLYSTNVYLKLLIQERFQKDIHFIWCSEHFDSNALPRYSFSSNIAPSSNPADIYKELKAAVKGNDKHCPKIIAQKLSLKNLALVWEENGEINSNDKEEIIYMVDNASFDQWRPLIYVTPHELVKSRLKIVPPDQRASLGMEYILPDLKRNEFGIIEL